MSFTGTARLFNAKQGLAVTPPTSLRTKAVAEKLGGATVNGHSNGQKNGFANEASVDIHGNQVIYGPTMNAGTKNTVSNLDKVEPPSAEVQAILDERGFDLEVSGLKYLSNEARVCLALLCSILLPPLIQCLNWNSHDKSMVAFGSPH